MTDIDLTAAIRPTSDAIYRQLSGQYGDFSTPSDEEAEAVLEAALPHILAQVEARVKPSREEIIAAIRRCNYPDGPIINSISMRVAEVSADAVLALLPGRTEAEVREQVAQELLSDASGRPFPHAYVRLMCPLKGEHPVRTFRAAVEILARGIARGGERS